MLAIAGDRVRLDALPARGAPLLYAEHGIVDGVAFDGDPTADYSVRPESDPRGSTREEGEAILAAEVQAAVAAVERELAHLGLARR